MAESKPSQALESILKELENLKRDSVVEIGVLLIPRLTEVLIGKQGMDYFVFAGEKGASRTSVVVRAEEVLETYDTIKMYTKQRGLRVVESSSSCKPYLN